PGIAKVAQNLHRSLVDGGWLFVGAVETSASLNNLFSPYNAPGFPGATLYGKQISPAMPEHGLDYNPFTVLPGQVPENGSVSGFSLTVNNTQSPCASERRGLLAQALSANSDQPAENEDFNALCDVARS